MLAEREPVMLHDPRPTPRASGDAAHGDATQPSYDLADAVIKTLAYSPSYIPDDRYVVPDAIHPSTQIFKDAFGRNYDPLYFEKTYLSRKRVPEYTPVNRYGMKLRGVRNEALPSGRIVRGVNNKYLPSSSVIDTGLSYRVKQQQTVFPKYNISTPINNQILEYNSMLR